jgi:hypothetical protein
MVNQDEEIEPSAYDLDDSDIVVFERQLATRIMRWMWAFKREVRQEFADVQDRLADIEARIRRAGL